jgi:hypothetical protein
MTPDEVTKWVALTWSVFAILGGTMLLIFRERFIRGNSQTFRRLFDKTQFLIFKFQADNMDSTSMRMISVMVAIILIAVGIYTVGTYL